MSEVRNLLLNKKCEFCKECFYCDESFTCNHNGFTWDYRECVIKIIKRKEKKNE